MLWICCMKTELTCRHYSSQEISAEERTQIFSREHFLEALTCQCSSILDLKKRIILQYWVRFRNLQMPIPQQRRKKFKRPQLYDSLQIFSIPSFPISNDSRSFRPKATWSISPTFTEKAMILQTRNDVDMIKYSLRSFLQFGVRADGNDMDLIGDLKPLNVSSTAPTFLLIWQQLDFIPVFFRLFHF